MRHAIAAACLYFIASQAIPANAASTTAPKELLGSWTIRGLASSDGSCLEANTGYYPVTVSGRKVGSTQSKCEILKLVPGKQLPHSYHVVMRCSLLGGKPFNKTEGWLYVNEKGHKNWVRLAEGSSPSTWEPCRNEQASPKPSPNGYVIAPEKLPATTPSADGGAKSSSDDELAGISEDVSAPPAKPKIKPEPPAKTPTAADADIAHDCDDGSTMTYIAATREMKIARRDGFSMVLPHAGAASRFSYWGLGEDAYACDKAPCAMDWAPLNLPRQTYYMVEQDKQVYCKERK